MRNIPSWVLVAVVLVPIVAHAQVGAVPQFDYSAKLGCGDVFFHAANDWKTEYLRIEVDFSRLRSAASREVFDLAAATPNVVIDVAVYRSRQINPPNCNDLFLTDQPANPPEVWRAIAGSLEIERDPKGLRPEEPWLFKARLRLSNVRFRGPNGIVVEMHDPFTWEGFVGWQAG